ncbi:MAG TPA: VWA domain-containing protein [Oculatellaceae cyanobacterium]
MKRQKASLGFNVLLATGLGFCAAAMMGWVQSSVQMANAQVTFNPMPRPITGNVHQNQYAAAAAQEGPENIMILLDSSYSMSEPIGGHTREDKMTAAKRTVLEVLRNVPPTTRVGLRVYGNSSNQFTACSATTQLVPLGVNNRHQIAAQLIGVRPTGATPISYSITRSLDEDFRGVTGKKTIILISDGMETCGEDPCDVAVRMQRLGANVKISVVGLGLQDYAATKQLRCVALATKGQFYSANTAAELANSLSRAMAVETKVQGTILPTSDAQMGNAPVSSPAAVTPPRKKYEEKELPAVPIQSNRR